MLTKDEDRRAHPRATLASPAVAFVADQRVDCRAIDISIAGIALLTPVVREPGQFLRVNFSLAPPGGIPRWYDADGVVVRVAPASSGVVIGVQFVVVDDRVARDVHEYVAEMTRREPKRTTVVPDALNPPARTGEFCAQGHRTDEHLASSEPVAPRRRTAEYGRSDLDRTPGATARPAAEVRRATPVPTPRTSVVAPTPAPNVDPSASRLDLDRLFREALSEVDGKRAGGRKDRRGK